MKRYVLLLRHGAVDRDPKKNDKEQSLKKGADDICLVVNILAEHLNLLPEEDAILIGEIWSGSYQHTKQSAKIVFDTLKNKVQKNNVQEIKEVKELDPDVFRLIKDKEDRQKVGQWLLDKSKNENLIQDKPANAVLVVGHAPQINWIAEKILRRPLPIARAELVCIAVSNFWWDRLIKRDRWLMWTIWDANPELTKELYEKIDSKMKLASILGSLITGILVFLLKSLLDPAYLENLIAPVQTALFVSAIFFFMALGLYFGAMYAYDRLMMPIRFWSERSQWKERKWLIQRPPGSATWVIYQNMVRIWNWLFTPATVAVTIGLLVLAYAVYQPNIIVVSLVILIMIFLLLYYRNFRPALGTDD